MTLKERLGRVYSATREQGFWTQTYRRALVLAAMSFAVTVASSLLLKLETGVSQLSAQIVVMALLSGLIAFIQTLRGVLNEGADD